MDAGPDRCDEPNRPRGVSRRTVLRGLAGAGVLSVIQGVLPAAASAITSTTATSTGALSTTPGGLLEPIEFPGRLMHGAWIGPGPTDATHWAGAYDAYTSATTGTGKVPAIINFFRSWRATGGTFPSGPMDTIRSYGAVPMLTWEPWDETATTPTKQPTYSYTSIINGTWDSLITSFAQGAADWGKPFLLRFAHEMNTGTYPWGSSAPGVINGNTATDYPAYWQHVRDIFNYWGASNAIWAWVPNINTGSSPSMASMYPGDAYVDWVGLDGYNGYGSYSTTWNTYVNLFEPSFQLLAQATTSKPIMIGETACTDPSATCTLPLLTFPEAGSDTSTSPHQKNAWLQDLFKQTSQDSTGSNDPGFSTNVPNERRNLRAVCYFNENKAGKGNWAVTPPDSTSHASNKPLDGYKTGLANTALRHANTTKAALPALADLIDNFGTAGSPATASPIDRTKWNNTSTDVTSGLDPFTTASSTQSPQPCAVIHCGTTASYLGCLSLAPSGNRFRLANDGVYFRVMSLPTGGTSRFRLIIDEYNELNFTASPIAGSSTQVALNAKFVRGGVTTTVNTTPLNIPVNGYQSPQRWWRLREALGSIYWETCANATSRDYKWVKLAEVYNLFRDSQCTIMFDTIRTAASSSNDFCVGGYNVGRMVKRPPPA